MYKLNKILNEIKLIGNVTPEMVEKIYLDLIFNDDNIKAVEILANYDYFKVKNNENQFNDIYDKRAINNFLKDLNKDKLKQIYLDLLNLKNNKINEIKIIGTNITPEELAHLNKLMANKIFWDYKQYFKEYEKLRNKYSNYIFKDKNSTGWTSETFKNLPKNILFQIYRDILNFQKEYNIK